MRTFRIITVIAVIAILLLAFFLMRGCSATSNCNEQNVALAFERDSLQQALNQCMGIMSPEDSMKMRIANLEAELARRGDQKPVVIRQSAPRAATPNRDVPQTTFKQEFKRSEPAPAAPQTVVEEYAPSGATLPVTDFQGDLVGDFGTTIDGKGNLIYYVRQSMIAANKGSGAPRLNGEGGAPFTLDRNTGYWYLVDNRLISAEQINNSSYPVRWNIYIGRVNYGAGSYPAFLPHESLKPLIESVRGFEYGQITNDDLAQMANGNKSIANGTIKPLRLSENPGRENKNFWHGWDFVTKIYAKRKTTTF